MPFRSRYSFILCFLLLAICSCTKKTSAPQSSFELVEHLPQNAIAFATWDSLNPRNKEFNDSKWAQMYDFTTTDSAELNSALSLLKIFNKESFSAGSIKEGLAFYTVEKAPAREVDAAYIVTAREGASFISLKSKIVEELDKQGVKYEKQNDEKVGEIFRFQLKDIPPGWPSEFFLSITESMFTLTSSRDFLDIRQKSPVAEKNPILNDPRYQDYVKSALAKSSYQIGAANLDLIVPILNDAMKAAAPEAPPADSPYSLVAMDAGFNKGPYINWDFINRENVGNTDPGSLRNSDSVAQIIPSSASLSFEISGRVITSILGDTGVPTGMDIAALIKRVGLFVRDGGIGSLVPEISIAISSDDPSALRTKTLDLLKSLSMLAQGAISPWQSAKIGKVDVDYAISPIGGFGVYIGNVEGSTIISSSDKIFTYYQDPNEVGSSLAKKFEQHGTEPNKSAVSGHVDFVKLVALIDSLKGTASLFAPQADTTDIGLKTDFMKQFGFMSFQVLDKTDRLSTSVSFVEE